MAAHELVGHGARDVRDREASGLGGELRLKDHLQEEVAELVAERVRIIAFDRLEHLVRLLDHVGAEALGRLLAIPRAAAGAAQPCHDVHEAQERVGQRALGHRGTVSAAHGRVNARCTTGPRGLHVGGVRV